ncbi:HTH domain-containing protein [Bifidobacterium biavatii]|uniref:Uncharacterized protein n=1 Tax=Bifidobacterium biavatii DSM 23969 TaxID=1437608 RepID=A0A087A4N2_9BIFI|nr:HTH domain-containing protein [Bifidobacterium biavatii]KFI53732.1 hypothetical protein BBIA_1330 [Bifidobacterium biavatii DSM 23969]
MSDAQDVERDASGRRLRFTDEQRAYLESLPAVVSVSGNRIVFHQWFREDFLRRVDAGEGPVAIFRAAGLDPSIVGYKRIERCTSRWRHEREKAVADGVDEGLVQAPAGSVSDAPVSVPGSAANLLSLDVCNRMLVQQTNYIDRLEQENADLKRQIQELQVMLVSKVTVS